MTAAPEVRRATVDDVGAIVRLVESAYRGERSRQGWTTEADLLDGQRTDDAAVRAIVAGPGHVLLAVDGDDVVACCQLEPRGATCYFGLFAVDPTRQAAGIGGRLLDAAERDAVALGATAMEMTVIGQRAELLAWYERRGYTRTGETRPFPYGDERFGLPRRDDLHFVVLTKRLRPDGSVGHASP